MSFMTQGIREWQKAAYENSNAHGFHEDGPDQNIGTKLALIHSEVSEALEEYRRTGFSPHEVRFRPEDGKPEGFGPEIADIVIRCMDLCGWLGLDLEAEIDRKHKFNVSRPIKHGKAF